MKDLMVRSRELLLAKWNPMPKAKNSGLEYIRHIDEGLKILGTMTDNTLVHAAFVLHPLVQDDEDYMSGCDAMCRGFIPGEVICLVLEYRKTANAYLPRHTPRMPDRSPDPRVNMMLLADKRQNMNDLILFNHRHPRFRELLKYFEQWIYALGGRDYRE